MNRTEQSRALRPIAHIQTDFPTKFGVPRQSGLANDLLATVIFEPEYRDENALRGIEAYSHLWLIWEFSENLREGWSPTVRPPRLGGNAAMGVFATRSPFRPNPIGLSCVKLVSVERTAQCGAVLRVSGADCVDGTPIYDIKPYLPYADSHPEATGGFTDALKAHILKVEFPAALQNAFTSEQLAGLIQALSQDPRPGYRRNDERPFGFLYAGRDVRFTVSGDTLTVLSCEKVSNQRGEKT
ncbi:MAG: tRNA (N6-threonylcarbamoyladenosine(37)-N6)-methyltransferase TrmO [Clostridia bacterium]|nr:tRNA (N6-threonylcarbamoyladenosine(37)-N6)-methyltransferase TrmO [Clostridia bacterium]